MELILNLWHTECPQLDQLLIHEELLALLLMFIGEQILLEYLVDELLLGVEQLCIDQIGLKFFSLLLQMAFYLFEAIQLLVGKTLFIVIVEGICLLNLRLQ